jgi:HlyD family secretion protein
VDAYPHEVYHGTVSQVRERPIVTPAGATDPRADIHQATTQTGSSAGVVSYTAVLDVPNPGDHLLPGMTAVVTIDGAHRDRAIRIPNSALVFRPTPEVLRTIGATPAPPAIEGGRENRDVREVWKYDGERLTPVVVRAGLADDDWTEVVSGSLSAGDQLVTDATISERRPRLLSGL